MIISTFKRNDWESQTCTAAQRERVLLKALPRSRLEVTHERPRPTAGFPAQ